MLPYVTAATVIRRLNEVLGLSGWWDRYRTLPDGSVMCQLPIVIGGLQTSRQDVGVPSSTEEGRTGRPFGCETQSRPEAVVGNG